MFISTRAQAFTVIVVGLGTALGPLDSAVNVAFPQITGAFGLPLPMIQWVVICYVLTYASLMLGFGRLGDIFGHRRVFLIGILWSIVALSLCAAATSFAWLLFFRVLQGIGTALLLSCGPALITLAFPETMRSRIIAAYTMMFAIATAVGPSLGGALVDVWGWSAVFAFRVPIAVAALLLIFAMPEPVRPTGKQRFDLAGAGLLILALGTALLAVNQSQRPGWDGAATLGLVAVAAISFAVFLWHESRTPQPILDIAMFRQLDFTLVNIANMAVQMAGFAVLLLAPYYFSRVMGASPTIAGLLLAASSLGMLLGASAGSRLVERFAAARLAPFSALLVAIGLLAASTWSRDPSIMFLVGSLLLHGFGLGLFQVAYFDIVIGSLSRAERGVAGSLTMVTRTIGVAVGVTFGAVLYSSIEADHLAAGAPAMDAFLAGFQGTFSWAGAVSLLCCGILILAGLRRKKKRPGLPT